MKTLIATTALVAFGLAACGKPAAEKAQAAAGVAVSSAWCRASPQDATAASCFLTVSNGGPNDDVLSGGQSSTADEVQVHETYADGNILRMRAVKGVTVPARKDVVLAPGGYVIRLMGLKAPMVVGSTVPVTLQFQAAGDKQILFPVRVEADADR